MNPVTLQKIDTLRENYLKDEKARVVRNALVKNDIGTLVVILMQKEIILISSQLI